MPQKYRRRKVFVDRIQYRMVAGNFLYLASVILALVTAGLVPLIRTLDNSGLSVGERDSAARQLLMLSDGFWIVIALVVALCIAHSVIVSHRIAGPLYRVKQCLGQLAAGDLAVRVHTRRADYLVNEVGCINRTLEELDLTMGGVIKGYAEVCEEIPGLAEALERQENAAALREFEVLKTRLVSLGRDIGKFHISDTEISIPQIAEASPVPAEPTLV